MSQLELLEKPDLSRAAARARAMQDARLRGEIGMERVAEKVEEATPGWCDNAVQALGRFAQAQGGVFTIEMARLVLERELPRVHDARCWGKVTTMALKRGVIERVKGQYLPAASSNGAVRAVYRRGPKA